MNWRATETSSKLCLGSKQTEDPSVTHRGSISFVAYSLEDSVVALQLVPASVNILNSLHDRKKKKLNNALCHEDTLAPQNKTKLMTTVTKIHKLHLNS